MKVKDVLRDLGPTTLVQIYKPSAGGYEACFLRAYSAKEIQNLKGCTWIDRNLDKDIDHVEYGHYYTTDELIGSCNIYLKAEPKAAETECELDAFFKKLDPDAYVYIDIWYGDMNVDAKEFIRVGMSGVDYSRIKKKYKSIDDLFKSLEITSINTDYKDKAIVLDCKRRADE